MARAGYGVNSGFASQLLSCASSTLASMRASSSADCSPAASSSGSCSGGACREDKRPDGVGGGGVEVEVAEQRERRGPPPDHRQTLRARVGDAEPGTERALVDPVEDRGQALAEHGLVFGLVALEPPPRLEDGGRGDDRVGPLPHRGHHLGVEPHTPVAVDRLSSNDTGSIWKSTGNVTSPKGTSILPESPLRTTPPTLHSTAGTAAGAGPTAPPRPVVLIRNCNDVVTAQLPT